MTYVASPDRYDSMPYRRCGRSGLLLPPLSLGLWHNFGHDRPLDVDPAWLPAGIEFVPDEDLSFDFLDRSEGVLTGCSFAIASTGTIVLGHAAGEGRRALTLIPDYHLCVVHAGQVVQTVPQAIRGAAERRPSLLTTISGPSATADIEMTRIRGVHGPRTLDVVLVV